MKISSVKSEIDQCERASDCSDVIAFQTRMVRFNAVAENQVAEVEALMATLLKSVQALILRFGEEVDKSNDEPERAFLTIFADFSKIFHTAAVENEQMRVNAQKEAKKKADMEAAKVKLAATAAARTEATAVASQQPNVEQTKKQDLFNSFHNAQAEGTDAIVAAFKLRMSTRRAAIQPEEVDEPDEPAEDWL